jgi:hypothetical protein
MESKILLKLQDLQSSDLLKLENIDIEAMIQKVKPLERFSMEEFHNQEEAGKKVEEAQRFVFDRKKVVKKPQSIPLSIRNESSEDISYFL